MRQSFCATLLIAASAGFSSMAGAADNTTAGSAAKISIDGHPTMTSLTGTGERWYRFFTIPQRSYCVEFTRSTFFSSDDAVDPVLDVFLADGTTLVGSNDESVSEPPLGQGSRFCFRAAAAHYTARGKNFSSLAVTANFDFRVVETTIFSPYYSVVLAAGYDAAAQFRNTTNTAVDVVFRARDATGAVLAGCPLTPTTIPAHGMLTFSIAQRCAASTAFGGADLTHDGPAGAVVGNITTFSAASGLSFDAAFSPRQDFQ